MLARVVFCVYLWTVGMAHGFSQISITDLTANLTGVKNLHSLFSLLLFLRAAVVQEVEKSFSNQKVASSIPCRSVLEQDTEPLIAPDVQCAISKNVYTSL